MTNIFDEVTYTVLKPEQFIPRERIKLNPEKDLPVTRYIDLQYLRNDVPVRFVISNSPENIRNAAWYSLYYQQAAYKERWQFKPQNYRIFTAPAGLIPVDGEGRVLYFDSPYKGEEPKVIGLNVGGRNDVSGEDLSANAIATFAQKMSEPRAKQVAAMLEWIIRRAEAHASRSPRVANHLVTGTGKC